MEIIIRIDSTKPINSNELRANAAWLVSIADDPDFFTRYAPGAAATPVVPAVPAAPVPTPPIPTPPAPPAPPANIPAAPATPAAPIAENANEVDANGLPWDERIHSGGKSKTAKGVWTKRKNVDDNTFATVSVELRNRMGAATPVVPAVPAAPVPTPPIPTPPAPPAPPANIPAAPATPAAPMPPGVPLDIVAITQAVQANRLTHEELGIYLTSAGVTSISDLFTNENARTTVAHLLREAHKIV